MLISRMHVQGLRNYVSDVWTGYCAIPKSHLEGAP